MTKKDERIYLYKTITKENNDRTINLEQFCKHNNIVILYEDNINMFPETEQAYFIIYEDKKACIIMNKDIPITRQKEIGFYSVFKILKYRLNNKLDSSMYKLYTNEVMCSFYSKDNYIWNKKYVDTMCLNMTEEILLPSNLLPINIYKYINTSKINRLAALFDLSTELVEKRCRNLIKGTKNILEGIKI